MGKGQDKIARNLMDLQPTAIVELFQLFYNTVDSPGLSVEFHGGSNFNEGIFWQGLSYLPVPVETEGFEINGNGQVPRPKIRVSNKDYFVTKLLTTHNDFLHAKLVRKRTFVKYLDDKNFDGGNPWGEADASAELSNDTFIFSQKTAENKSFVEFELSSPLDVEGFDLTNRLILSRYCPWRYRGAGCNYQGIPIETEDLQPIPIVDSDWARAIQGNPEWSSPKLYQIGDLVSITNKGIEINDENIASAKNEVQKKLYYKDWFYCKTEHTSSIDNKPYGTNDLWLKDGCSKRLSACRKRFANDIGVNKVTTYKEYTRSYVDFSALYVNPSNNVASVWNSVSAYPDEITSDGNYHPFRSAVDGNIATEFNPYSTYWSATVPATGVFYLKNFIGKIDQLDDVNVDRINVYNVYRDNKFGTTAKFSITGREPLATVTNVIVPEIIDGGTTGRFTLIGNFLDMSGVSISGIGGSGIPTLDQIEILDYRRNRGLINYNFTTEKIHQNEGFLIGMWIEFPETNTSDTKKINLVHNIKTGCQYSGFNVYIAGSDLICDFAVVSVSGISPVSTIINKSLSCDATNFINGSRNCLFLENYQFNGHSTGSPLARIRLTDEFGISLDEYYLAQKDSSINFEGEYFYFKDPTKQDGIGDLSFGINDWEDYKQGLVYTSPIKWGSIAIWGKDGEGDDKLRYRNFGRNDTMNLEEFYSFDSLEAKSTLRNNLFAWWDADLDLNGEAFYSITSAADSADGYKHKLYLTGSPYVGLALASSIKVPIVNLSNYSIPTPTTPIPFGGFPGTDKYGY